MEGTAEEDWDEHSPVDQVRQNDSSSLIMVGRVVENAEYMPGTAGLAHK